jgi:PAS domain S-box-containing protein
LNFAALDGGVLRAILDATAEALFGYEVAEVAGRNVSILMPEPAASAHSGHLTRYLETGEARVIGREREETGRRKNGTTFPIALRVHLRRRVRRRSTRSRRSPWSHSRPLLGLRRD